MGSGEHGPLACVLRAVVGLSPSSKLVRGVTMNVTSTLSAIAVFIFATSTAWAEGCACNIFPFEPEPPCFDECAATLLIEADPDRLEAVLDLAPATTFRIQQSRYGGVHPTSLEKLSIGLDDGEKKYVSSKIRKLSEEEFEYLRDSMH